MSKIKILKGLASLFKKKGAKPKTFEIGPPRDPEVNYETIAALKKSRKRYNLEKQNLNPLQKELDAMLEKSSKKATKQTNDLKIALSELDEISKQIDEFNRIADDSGVDEALIQLEKILNPKRTLNADGGRIEMMSGGILKGLAGLLRPKAAAAAREVSQMRPKLQMGQKPAQIGDMEQIKNIIRDPRTDLERILKERVDGTQATPIDTVTIRELEQMFLDSPRYTDKEKLVLFKFMDKEKIRANHFHNTGEELPDDMLEMLYRSGEGDFNQGGRVGMFRGGMGRRAKDRQKEGITGSIGGLGGMGTPAPGTGAKGPAGGQTMNPNKAGVNLNERPDNIDIGQIDKLSSNFNIKDLVKDYSSLNNNFSPNIYTGAINPIYSGYVNEEEPSIIDTLNRYNIFRGNIGNFEYDIDPLKQELDASYSFNQGGRVGMFMGGIPAALKGAAMLAKRGMKPFGQKQTYRQNVKTTGMDELQKGMKQEFDKELYLIDKGRRGGNPEAELFDLYEDIASGKRYSMLPEATRSKMITKIEDSMKAMDVDGGDYQNFRTYLNEEYGFPNETAFDAIRKGVDKGQIKTMKAEDLLDKLDKASGKNVIPFKKPKKAEGGRVNYATGSIVDQLFPDTTPKMQTTQKEALTSAQEVFESLYPSADNAMFYTSALMGTKPKSSRYKRTLKNLLNAITVADGGLIPPQKGPMSDGMGSLFRRK